MEKFKVYIKMRGTISLNVEAENSNEAVDKAYELFNKMDDSDVVYFLSFDEDVEEA